MTFRMQTSREAYRKSLAFTSYWMKHDVHHPNTGCITPYLS